MTAVSFPKLETEEVKAAPEDFEAETVMSTVASSTLSREERLREIKDRVQNMYCQEFSIKGTCKYGKNCWRKHHG
ncbi:MAG: hypothetical protein ACK56F_20605 [bacterium]